MPTYFRFGLLPVDIGNRDVELRRSTIQAFFYVSRIRGSRDAFDWLLEVR